jgi:hypothetical protein
MGGLIGLAGRPDEREKENEEWKRGREKERNE